MTVPINIPEALFNNWRGAYQALFNLGAWAPTEYGGSVIHNNEIPVYQWIDDTIYYARAGQDFNRDGIYYDVIENHPGTAPRWEFRGVHVSDYDHIDFGESTAIGAPKHSTDVQYSDILYPGGSAVITFTDSETEGTTLEQAVKDKLEAEAKVRLGSFSSPAGAELTSTISRELEKTFGSSSGYTRGVSTSRTVVNNEDHPVKIRVEAERTVIRERRHCIGMPVFDYQLLYFPFEGRRKHTFAFWENKAQFLSSMQGREPSNVGQVEMLRGEVVSYSEIARHNRSAAGIVLTPVDSPIPFTVDYTTSIIDKFNETRERV